jgi:predicted ATPase/DNA-binding SARP family transcriptional activator
MAHPLEIRLLGPLDVLTDGSAADVTGSKRRALLALLALRRGRVVDVDALIGALWGEELPSAPRNALQHHVARLRAALGHDAIEATAAGYALTDTAWVDALQFEKLLDDGRYGLRQGDVRAAADAIDQALGLWRGPALHGLTETAWFDGEARRLEALRIDALEEKFEAALALGQHRELVSALRLALEADPFRERLWGQLMLALYRGGRQADALETYQEARRVLAEQLGLEPGPALRQLQEAILSHDPAIAPVAAAAPRGNLPAPTTSFVGREEEIAQIGEQLRRQRLVTLSGPPGVGKSRLAVEAGRMFGSEVRGGVWRVDLARATAPDDAARLLADALDARGPEPLARVVARLRHAEAIVLLDACEHAREEAGRIAAVLLAECPGVRVLATSREPLHLTGEVRVAVHPLPLPDSRSGDPSAAAATQLFVARAQAARPEFELTADTAPLVAEITRRLDGLPLAIELAAARVNVLGLAELRSVVDRRLTLLDRGGSSVPEQIGLQRLVEWSYDLLHADEKLVLQQLAVHRGGASLPSLVGMGGARGLDEPTVTFLVAALVDKSIVSVSFPDGAARYDLLDTVRDYVVRLLGESGELAAVQTAHAEYFAAVADEGRLELRGPAWREWTRRFAPDNDNLWAALTYAEETAAREVAVRLGTLGWYFVLAERISEGRVFLDRVRTATTAADFPLDRHLDFLALLCFLATEELDLTAAIEVGESGLALTAGDAAPWQLGLVQVALALAFAHTGDAERAAALAEAGSARLAPGGDHWSIAACNLLRASIAAASMDVAATEALAADARRHAEAIGFDAFRVPALLVEAWVAEQQGDQATACRLNREAGDLATRIGFPDHAAYALTREGAIAAKAGDLERAADLLREASDRAASVEASLAAAQADVELADVLRTTGEVDGAARLYHQVLEWSEAPRPHHARESLFLALAGNPADRARRGLAEIAARPLGRQ